MTQPHEPRSSSARSSSVRARTILVVVSAALHALAFPPWDQPLAAWVALAPLLLALRGVSARSAAAFGLLWGTLSIWAQGYWVPLGISYYYDQPLAFGLLFALGASLVFYATYAALFAFCVVRLPRSWSAFPRCVAVAALFVSSEWARASLLSGDPWLLLGYAMVPGLGFAQIAAWGGVYLLSFFLVLANAALVETWVGFSESSGVRLKEALTTLALAVLVPGVYGVAHLLEAREAEESMRIAVVQGNQDFGAHWREEFYGVGLEEYLELSSEVAAAGAELVVWPESSVNFLVESDPPWRFAVEDAVRSWGTQLILGGPHAETDDAGQRTWRNSAFLVDPEQGLQGRYDKRRLLPFGEYFPLRMISFLRRFERVRSFTPGEGSAILETARGKVGVSICFEAIFPDEVRRQVQDGARVLLNLSNDAWLGPGAGPEQHLLMVRLRAIENGIWVVRATTTGISAVINPFGAVERSLPRDSRGVIGGEVGLGSRPTFYGRYGDVFAALCVLISLVALFAAARSR